MYITNILGPARLYTKDYFVLNPFSDNGYYFRVSLLYIKDNRLGGATMVSPF